MDGKQIMIGGVVLAAAAFGLKVWFEKPSTTPTGEQQQPVFDQGNKPAPTQPQVNANTPQQGGAQQWQSHQQPMPTPVSPPQTHTQPMPSMQGTPVAVGNSPDQYADKSLKWDVVVDPPLEPVVYSGLDKLKIAMPDKTGERDLLFPEGLSPFVALGNDKAADGSRVVQDLRDPKKRFGAVLKKPFKNHPVALSRNGAHLALYIVEQRQIVTAAPAPAFRGRPSAPSVQMQTVSEIEVFDVAGKKLLGALTMSGSGGNTSTGTMASSTPRPALLAFCGDEYLVAANDDGAATVWEMPSGRQARSFTLPNMRDTVTSTSPGGRYLAIAKGARGGSSSMSSGSTDGELLSVYDVVSGQVAGQARLPANGICVGLAFSPDGEEIAALYRESRGSKLVVVTVADGTTALETELPRVSVPNVTNSNGPMLQWFPNRERWLLFGQLMLSRESGEATRLPTDKGLAPNGLCRVLDDTHVLRVFGDKGKYNLKAVELAGGEGAAAAADE